MLDVLLTNKNQWEAEHCTVARRRQKELTTELGCCVKCHFLPVGQILQRGNSYCNQSESALIP